MGRIVIVIGFFAIALLLVTWFSRMSTVRQKWLASLELPGSWAQDSPSDEKDPTVLTFNGELNHGTYEMRRNESNQQGTWRISQSSLILSETTGDETTYEIRYFEQGKIGLHGNSLDRQTFIKQTDNIVPLRRT